MLSMPLTKKNHGVVGEEELKTLPDHAILLNPARGPLVDEQAMLKALREGWIAGAALDTHWYYPLPADHPIRRFPNVILTPHIGSNTAETQDEIGQLIVKCVATAGQAPPPPTATEDNFVIL